MKVLFVTVGGTDKPIVTSIIKNKPDLVYFFATETTVSNKGSKESVDGDGFVCEDNNTGEKRVSIVAQTRLLPEKYKIIIVESDNPYNTYTLAVEKIIKHLHQNDYVIVDYTGGTKSMSVGLAIAGMEFPECDITIVAGIRKDLVKIRNGMERIEKLPTNSVFIQRQLRQSENLISKRSYNAAYHILDELSANNHIAQKQQFNRLYYLAKAFDEWDKFNYHSAVDYIEMFKKDDEFINSYNSLVKKLAKTVEWFEDWKPESKNPPGLGFILVYDLLNNAERKAEHRQYDDAIARVYRAVEMYEQFSLMTGEIKLNTSDIDVSLLPEQYVDYYEKKRSDRNKKIQIGLEEGYRLLSYLNHPVGEVWKNWEAKLRNVLQKRNYSYLAHGNKPLYESDYNEMKNVIWPFINECDQALNFKQGFKDYQQLPTKFH
ncbi:MAG TPA: TIGR02710 family CRISPR-associated protein [Bacillus bacterium]|nr:TIGR02710 family CRISPR-associated protein [Bacillus sp. (in: firmicutes)]